MKNKEARKLSAIMFTDMVGYSRLVQENESRALELLEEHRRILRLHFPNYGGREIETAGDSFFVEFYSALEAVQCAIHIQKELWERNNNVEQNEQINIRIGIHIGDVEHRGDSVLGDGVNIAARIEPLARTCGICLSEDVARQVQNKIELPLEPIGKEELKNIRMPVNIFSVVLPWEKSAKPKRNTVKSLGNKLKRWQIVLITVIVLFMLVFYFFDDFVFLINHERSPVTTEKNLKRLAVLPFDNFSPDQSDLYIANGFTEEIITVLSKIKDLHVIARKSVMKYRNEKKSIAEIARELNIDIAVEGSIRKDQDRIRVTVQLIDANTEAHLWADSYDKKFEHIFAMQDDIAFKIANTLQITLRDIEKSNILKRSTANMDAYDIYLQGRYYWNLRTAENLMKGMELFNRAVQADSNFALAYAGIADSYHLLTSYGVLSPKEGFTNARRAALKAIEKDSNLAEGYNALGAINLLYFWNWNQCEKYFRKALDLNPAYVQTYSWYALYFQVHRQFDRATELVKKSIELDPLSAIARTDLGQINYHAGNFKQAITEYRKSLELDSGYVYTYAYLGQAYAMSDQYTAAEQAFQKAVQLTGNHDPATLSGLAYVFAKQGKNDQARAIINRLEIIDKEFYVHPMYFAIIYGALGEIDQAFGWLEKGINDRSEWMIYLKVEHMLDTINKTPQYEKIVKKLNFNQFR